VDGRPVTDAATANRWDTVFVHYRNDDAAGQVLAPVSVIVGSCLIEVI